MDIRRVVPDILCERLEESRDFYVDLLGFKVPMDMGWTVHGMAIPNARIKAFSIS